MKIIITCGNFHTDVGYHEVALARAFSELGNQVTVITSDQISVSLRNRGYEGTDFSTSPSVMTYNIIRLKTLIRFKSIVIPKGLVNEIQKINSDLIILFGIGKMFQLPLLLSGKSLSSVLISFFGDNEDMQRRKFISYFKNKYRKILYRRAIIKSDKFVLYTPSTQGIIEDITNKNWFQKQRYKQINSSLGFDKNVFFYDPDLGATARKELNISEDELVLVYSSRIVQNKGLEEILKAVDETITEGKKLKMILIGLFNDQYGNYVRKLISGMKSFKEFILLEFLDQRTINKYFNCADAGIWGQASISIQQAMGTGLFVLLPKRESVSHLITGNLNGSYYSSYLSLKNSIKALEKSKKRDLVALSNQKLNNLNICRNILKEIKFRQDLE